MTTVTEKESFADEEEDAASAFFSMLKDSMPRAAATRYAQDRVGDWKQAAEDLAVMIDQIRKGHISVEPAYDISSSPLSLEMQEQLVEEADGKVDRVIRVSLEEIIDNDYSGFYELLSNRAVGHGLLREICYDAEGTSEDGKTIFFRVTGYLPTEQ